jgi:hypothetical protein
MASMPARGQLIDWLRDEAGKPFETPRGDVGDQLPLQWLARQFVEMPQEVSRLTHAVEALLGEGDLEISRRLLEVISDGPPAYRSAVARAVGKHAQVLGAVDVPGANRTLLGLAVASLGGDRLAEPLGDDTLAALGAIARPEDGWPASVAIGARADYPRFADALSDALQTLDGAPLDRFDLDLYGWVGPPATTDGFDRLGREASDEVRRRVGAAIKRQIDELAEARRTLEQLNIPMPPVDPPDVRWADAARRLQIPA